MFDTDAYDKMCDEMRAKNAEYLSLFEKELVASGVSRKTIDTHISNVDFFLNDFLLYSDIYSMADGTFMASDFLGDYFIRKCSWSTPTSIKTTATSFKKFYKCMLDHGLVAKEDFDHMCAVIKDNLSSWQESCSEYKYSDDFPLYDDDFFLDPFSSELIL